MKNYAPSIFLGIILHPTNFLEIRVIIADAVSG